MANPTTPSPSNPRGGRPRLPADEARSERLVTLLTVSEKARIEARAASLGLSLSEYVRGTLLRERTQAPPKASPPDAALATLGRAVVAIKPLLQALHPLNNNINQIARYLHTDRNVIHWIDEEQTALKALTERLQTLVEQAETALRKAAKW